MRYDLYIYVIRLLKVKNFGMAAAGVGRHRSVLIAVLFVSGFINPGSQVARATVFCTVAPNVCGSAVRNLLYVTLLASRNLS